MEEDKLIEKFVGDQLSVWPLAAANFRALKNVETRSLKVGGLEVRLQHNPARIRSSAAKVDKASLQARKCFLCAENRPQEQRHLEFEGRKERKYDVLINPYPIFPNHLVIARNIHTPQSIWHRMTDMTDLARHHPSFTIFYNGPKCGASAPDHFHFQACPHGLMPLEADIDKNIDLMQASGETPEALDYVTSVQDANLYHYGKFTRGVFVLTARTSKSMAKLFYRLVDCLPQREDETEPMFNLLCWYRKSPSQKLLGISHGRFGEYRAVLLARDKHRSHHYFSDGPDHLTMSPGCADMAGLFIVPNEEDYAKLNAPLLEEMLSEVSVSEAVEKNIIWKLTRTQREVHVGVMSGKEICFEMISDGAGKQKVVYENGRISYNGALYDELLFDSITMSSMFAEPTFMLYDVTIGVGFHWERKQVQKFAGSLKFIVNEDKIIAVNIVGIEDYLLSVISSEMKASSSLELLKAHAVISRSWLLAQIEGRKAGGIACENSVKEDFTEQGTRHYVRWYDHKDHELFDVCADDHCQRYQGLTAAVGDNVRKAVDETWGEVLTDNGKLCDARFSKCCGGMMEKFSTCWEDKDFPYLKTLPDTPEEEQIPDLTVEENAEKWITGEIPQAEKSFCNTSDVAALSQVLNDYDMETRDFFRWKARYTRGELSALISQRSGQDIGLLESIEPLKRGPSGRIELLSIKGSKSSMVIGKELVIRKFLSTSHLKSSAFVVREEKSSDNNAENDTITLLGAGWGHGVGLCQIGAAMMAVRGYSYRDILLHYYPGSVCARINDQTHK